MNLEKYNLGYSKIKILSFIVYLLPIFLIFSIFVADLIVVIISLFFFYISYKNNFKYLENIYFKYFILYWIYISILSLSSLSIADSLKSSLPYIRFIIFPLIIFYLIRQNNKFLTIFFYTMLFIILTLIFDSFYEFFIGKNILGYGNLEKGRLVSFFKDEYILGSYITKMFFLTASLWFIISGNNNKKKKHYNYFFFGLFYISCFTVVFLSGDRMPLLLFILGSIIFLILSNFKIRFKLLFVLISISIILSTLSLNQKIYDRLVKRTLLELGYESGLVEGSRIYKIQLDSGKTITFLTQHQNYLITSYNIFKENPIFGKGNKGFKLNCAKYKIDSSSCSSHPHNTYIQLLVENGIIGFLFFFSIFLYLSLVFLKQIFFKIKKNNDKILSNSQLCILICIYLNLWPLVQTGNFFNNWIAIMYYLPIGFLLNEFTTKDNNFFLKKYL